MNGYSRKAVGKALTRRHDVAAEKARAADMRKRGNDVRVTVKGQRETLRRNQTELAGTSDRDKRAEIEEDSASIVDTLDRLFSEIDEWAAKEAKLKKERLAWSKANDRAIRAASKYATIIRHAVEARRRLTESEGSKLAALRDEIRAAENDRASHAVDAEDW